ncbi:ATP-binding cassette, subfamily B [Evansella caseinilytica]|uniref:ATP-binding cassette, subfamily B n=1 Tax=Evansella caseinilytica TaxID=1503961 RepID=A0A1H3TEU0_9BACI|nr:ABC transporter ATP-binding protein [Evansella caseinilytica]SDZ48467.1 ATP-binding cassette, subfamily B [Evansella caseinilytica]
MLTIMKFLKPYRWQIVFIILFTLGGTTLELLLPTLMAEVVDVGIVNSDLPYILQTGGWMIACAVLAVIFTVAVMFFSSKTALGFSKDVRRSLFTKVESFSLQEVEKVGTASLITRTTNDIKQVQDVLNMIFNMMTRAPLMLLGGIILAVMREPSLSLIFLASLPALALTIILISRKAIPLFKVLQKKTDRLNLILRETLTGIRVVRGFNRVEYEKKRFNEANEQFRDTGIKVNRIIAFVFPLMMLIMNFTNIAIVWLGAVRIDNGVMQVGNLMAFLQYAAMILMSLVMLSMAFIMIPRAQASAVRINEVLQLSPDMKNPDEPETEIAAAGTVAFQNVTFRYNGAEKAAVENISFKAEAGKTTAIIGSTGSGKTTLIQLIPRFYDVESGSIAVDGVDIRKMSVKHLRGKIGYVPQRAVLFSGTIAENVRFGKEDATDQEVAAALETAQAIDFVTEKEQGTSTAVSQGGGNLSGGQKQRLSIARALVRKPDIYIFDDSFSALDYKTDAKLRKALKEQTKKATFIIVAQRVNTVRDADQIIVLNEGKIAGIGTHQELLESCTIYQEIVSSQRTEEESA